MLGLQRSAAFERRLLEGGRGRAWHDPAGSGGRAGPSGRRRGHRRIRRARGVRGGPHRCGGADVRVALSLTLNGAPPGIDGLRREAPKGDVGRTRGRRRLHGRHVDDDVRHARGHDGHASRSRLPGPSLAAPARPPWPKADSRTFRGRAAAGHRAAAATPAELRSGHGRLRRPGRFRGRGCRAIGGAGSRRLELQAANERRGFGQHRRGDDAHFRGGLLGGPWGGSRLRACRRRVDAHPPEPLDPVAQVRHHPRHAIAHLGGHLLRLPLGRAAQGGSRRVVGVRRDHAQRDDRNQEEREGQASPDAHACRIGHFAWNCC